MTKTLHYKTINQKYLVTTNQDEIPIGSIIFWHDHHLIHQASKKRPGKHLIRPELIAHVGIVIGYDGQYPKIAHAVNEEISTDPNKEPIRSVIASRLQALDDRKKQNHSFIVFKPNPNNSEQMLLSAAMVEIATKLTHRDPISKESSYQIPYGVNRSRKMTAHIRSLFAQKQTNVKFETQLAQVTKAQFHETQYAFYHEWDYNQPSTKKVITDEPLDIHAAALVAFKNVAQMNHKDYQKYTQKNNQPAFTKHGLMCVQFIMWLGQCAIIESNPYDPLTNNVLNPKGSVEKISMLSRKYTRQDDENKIHVKRVLLHNHNQTELFSEADYKDLFSWLDHDGKMMAPGTLMQILMDQANFSDGGGEKPFIVDYYHVSKVNNRQTDNILDDINDLVTTLYQLYLKHKISIFDPEIYFSQFLEKIASLLTRHERDITMSELLQNRNLKRVAEQRQQQVGIECEKINTTIKRTFSHHSHVEMHFLGISIQIIMSVFLNKLKKTVMQKRKFFNEEPSYERSKQVKRASK